MAGVGLAARVIAIASVGVVFGQTTDSTRLVDSLVQQARVPERFAYGALAAYQAIPRLADQLTTLRQARRIRGLRWSWHPRLLVGLLVLAIRHGDRLALAMDARAFGSGPRSRYRVVRWSWLDLGVPVGALVRARHCAASGLRSGGPLGEPPGARRAVVVALGGPSVTPARGRQRIQRLARRPV